MRATRSMHRAQRDSLIKRRQTAAMLDGEREQIGIGQLVVPEQMFKVNHAGAADADVIRPELVIGVFGDLDQALPHRLKSERPELAVARCVEDAHDAILDQWTGGDLQFRPREQGARFTVEEMIVVEQRDQDIDVKQQAHRLRGGSNPEFVHDRTDMRRGDDLAARGEQGVFPLERCGGGLAGLPRTRSGAHQTADRLSERDSLTRGGLFGVKEGVVGQFEGGAHGGTNNAKREVKTLNGRERIVASNSHFRIK